MSYRMAEGVYVAENEEGLVILDCNSGKYFGLEGVAAKIWNDIVVKNREWNVLDQVADIYEQPRSVVRQDARDFFQELVKLGLVVNEKA